MGGRGGCGGRHRARVFARVRASFPVALGCAAIAMGFATAAIKAHVVEHTVLRATAYSVAMSGFVETREERERSDRIVLRVTAMEGARLSDRPERIRLTVRKGRAPAVGAFVAMKARINPPTSPLHPGGYDLARDLYFQGIGATGLVLGAITPVAAPAPPGWRLRFATAVEAIRDGIDARIRAAIPGDTGAIASALVTGKRDALTGSVFDALFISGVGHVLSVSGYHMALVAGVVFFMLRAGLALVPGLALRRPIKKWAAAAALVAAACYLVLSGAEVATQRSFIMTAVVLIGVMADRPALTLRTIAVAALAVMLLAPEAVVHPSFQMSFAATLALIAAYERGIPWISAGADTSLGARVALWGAREAGFLMLASLVAGFATMPYAAYHFHRLAPYGVLANLLAMPVISAVSMPAGLLALVAMPFGFDGPLWRLMGIGIDWMIAVATWVAHLPGAVGHIPAFGMGALLLRHRRPDRALPAAQPAALGGRRARRRWLHRRADGGAAGRADFRDRRGGGAARRRRPPHRAQVRQQRCDRGRRLAQCRRRRAPGHGPRTGAGLRLRSRRLRGTPRRRRHRGGGAQPGRARRRLQPRRPGRDPARAAARLRRHGDRPQGVARDGRGGAGSSRREVRGGGSSAWRARSPVGAALRTGRSAASARLSPTAGARRDTAAGGRCGGVNCRGSSTQGGGSRTDRLERHRSARRAEHAGDRNVPPQYRRNSPTILPWMRTRLGGRMRTS